MGWTYNIVDPNVTTNAPVVAGVGVFFTILSLSVVSLRLYVRKYILKFVSIDDWFIMGTWLFSLIFLFVTLAETRWGLGMQHVEDVPPQNLYEFGKLQYAGAPFYIAAILGFKLSILLTFLRIPVDRTYRIGIICVSVACFLFHFSYFVAQLSFCRPVVSDSSIVDGSCLPPSHFYTAMSSLEFIFDVLTMLTPIPILLHSCFSLRQNVIIGLLFVLGTFTSLIPIIHTIAYQRQITYLNTSTIATWSLVEVNLGIVISSLLPLSSLPCIKSFLDKGPPQSLASFDTRRTIEKAKDGMKRKFGKQSDFRSRILLFIGYGELRPDLEREQGLGSRLGTSTEEFQLHFPMEILKTTEIIVSREGSSWGEIKEDEV